MPDIRLKKLFWLTDKWGENYNYNKREMVKKIKEKRGDHPCADPCAGGSADRSDRYNPPPEAGEVRAACV